MKATRDNPVQLALTPNADLRSAEILASVRQAFAEKGFDGASMQDLARTAGISVGSFYRYFPSKAAIVEALIALDLAEMERDFADILHSPRPMDALRAKLRVIIPEHQSSKDGQLWAEITAAALRKPEIMAASIRMEDEILRHLAEVFAAQTGLSVEQASRRYAAHAALIVMLVKASACLCGRSAAETEHLNALVLRSIDHALDEITATAPLIEPKV
ncbi:MAG: TetR/AcrR family transcriptional regulator [Paracoccaceae bacterium]